MNGAVDFAANLALLLWLWFLIAIVTVAALGAIVWLAALAYLQITNRRQEPQP